MTKRIENAINVFLDALNNGTLAKGDCTKCAVGNLVREGCGWTLSEYNSDKLEERRYGNGNWEYINWSMIFCTSGNKQTFKRKTYPKVLEKYPFVKKQIESVDFTVEELAQIENAFEKNTFIRYRTYKSYTPEEIRKDQLRGLNAVIEVMLKFDEQKETVQECFTSKAELIPVC